MKRIFTITGLMLLTVTLSGCFAARRNPLPAHLKDVAQPIAASDVRAWGAEYSPLFQNDFISSLATLNNHKQPTINILSISAGGSNGAFGAGLLDGWYATGHRPTFNLITGMSIGALIGTFVFIHPYNAHVLYKLSSEITTAHIYNRHSFARLITGRDSLATSKPLIRLIDHLITPDVIAKVAEQYRLGRRFYVGTTNLDAHRLVIWNMGKVANSHTPQAIKLFRNIIVASASTPTLLPPVYITVHAQGNTYDEMHVDGGTSTQLFVYGFMIDLNKAIQQARLKHRPRIHLYVIRNAQPLDPYKATSRKLGDISLQSALQVIKGQADGDIYRLYLWSKKHRIQFNLAQIPMTYEPHPKEDLDPVEMKRLYRLGYRMGQSKNTWKQHPPTPK